MANYNNLKTAIQGVIKANGNQEITGDILQNALLSMINSLGAGYQFMGVATSETNPSTPDQKVFYFANGKGTYANFGGLIVDEDEVIILYYDTAWHKLLTGIASQTKLTELEVEVGTPCTFINATFNPVNGLIIDSTNRILSNFIGLGKFQARRGYLIAAIMYYNAETLKYDSAVQQINKQSYIINRKGFLARVLIKREDGSDFSPKDYIDGFILNEYINRFFEEGEKTDKSQNFILSNPFTFKQGGQTNNGYAINSTNRLISDFFSSRGEVVAKDGWCLKSVAYFNEESKVFDSYELLDSAMSAFVGKNNCVARLEIAKIDNSDCSPEEYYGNNIISVYFNKKIDSLKEDVKELIPFEIAVKMKFGKLVDGRLDVPHTSELYDDFLHHLRSPLYDISRLNKLERIYQRSDIIMTNQQVFRISKEGDLNSSAVVGDTVEVTSSSVSGWISSKTWVRAGETYVISGEAAGGRLPLVAVVNTSNVLTEKVDTRYSKTTVTIEIKENGWLIINNVIGGLFYAYRVLSPTVNYHYYDSSFRYLGVAEKVPTDAKYLRLSMDSDTEYNSEIELMISYQGFIVEVKEYGNTLEPLLAYYPVYLHNQNSDNEAEDELQDVYELTYDQVKYILPQNYSSKGEPVRLVIYVQGSNGSVWEDRSFNGADNLRAIYVAQEGYAVMMVNGITAKYHRLYPQVADNFATPTSMACYMAAYKWMTENFNIKTDGIFVYGKSLGGVGVGNILYSKLPVLAAAGLAPILDCVSEVMRNRDAQSKRFYADQFGMKGDITFTDRPVSRENQIKENAFFKSNAYKVIGYNPLWNGTIGLNTDLLLEKTYEKEIILTGEDWPEERALYESLPKYLPAPLKIWIARDDVNVDPRFCDYMQKMCQKGGSYFRIRWMPKNTGRHWAVDRGSEVDGVFQEPVSAEIKPKYYGENVRIAVAFIEMISWFRRFE